MMYKVITTFKKLMLTFLLEQNFASQIKMSHMSYLDLIFTEMTSIILTSEHPMELLCILKMILTVLKFHTDLI